MAILKLRRVLRKPCVKPACKKRDNHGLKTGYNYRPT